MRIKTLLLALSFSLSLNATPVQKCNASLKDILTFPNALQVSQLLGPGKIVSRGRLYQWREDKVSLFIGYLERGGFGVKVLPRGAKPPPNFQDVLNKKGKINKEYVFSLLGKPMKVKKIAAVEWYCINQNNRKKTISLVVDETGHILHVFNILTQQLPSGVWKAKPE